MSKGIVWFFLILLVISIILLIINYIKKRKIYVLIISVVLFVFCIYSFFTYDGALRLGVSVTTGELVSAYTTKFQKDDFFDSNYKYYYPTLNIMVESGSMGYMECRNYLLIKICNYYGY